MFCVFVILRQSYFVSQPSTIMSPVGSRSCVFRWGTRCTYLRNWKVSKSEHTTGPDTSPSYFSKACCHRKLNEMSNEPALHMLCTKMSMSLQHGPPDRLYCHHSCLVPCLSFTVTCVSGVTVSSGWYRGYRLRKKSQKVRKSLALLLSHNQCTDVYIMIWPYCFRRAFSHLPTST